MLYIDIEKGSYFHHSRNGKFETKEPWIHPEITVSTYEIIFVTSGTVFIEEDGEKYEIKTNESIILDPNKMHRGYKISDPPTSFYWMHFNTNVEPPYKTYRGNEYYDIKSLLKKLIHTSRTPGYSVQSADALSYLIYCEFMYQKSADLTSNRTLLKEITEYIRLNLKSNITIAEISAHLGYNADYLGKIFKQHFDIGLKKYIISEKINLAKDLLLTTNMSVKEISNTINFESYNAFLKFFIYHEGCSPKKFRDKYYNIYINNE